MIESPPDGPFELDSSFPAPDLSSLITPSLLDEFELHAKRSLPSTTFSDSLHGMQTYSQSACTPVTSPNAPQFPSFVVSTQRHTEPLAYTQMHASSGGLDQEHSVEPVRTAGAVIIPSSLLKGGIVHQSVVGQVPLKTEPLIASSGVKSENTNPLSLQQLLTTSNELQYLSNKKHTRNPRDPIVPTDRANPFTTSSVASYSSPNIIAQAAATSPP